MRLLHFAATGFCVAVAFGGACGSNEETVETPAATPTSSLGPVESLSPTPVATQDFGPSTATIEAAAESKNAITVDGRYILDLQLDELYRTGGHVSFSPDSRLAAVSECCATPGGLAVIDLGNRRRQEIARGYVSFVDWSPDGGQLAYSQVSGLPSNFVADGIFVWNRDTNESRLVLGTEGFRGLYWSPGGTHILYLHGSKVNLLEEATGIPSVIMDFGPDAERNSSIGVQWSPKGDRVAACALVGSSESGFRQAISVYDVEAKTVSEWGDVDSCQGLSWSLDGERLLVGGYSNAYVVTEYGRNLVVSSVRDVRWSPNSDQLGYISDGCVTGEFDVYLSNADGSERRRLTNTPNEAEEALSWSPDGSRLSFSVSEEVAVVDVLSGNYRTEAASASESLHLHALGWSPNGRYIEFSLAGGHGICD